MEARTKVKHLSAPLFFLRHGQTNWNLEKRLQGLNDVSLNKTGFQQAKSLAPLIHKLEIKDCICSPMLRARQTLAQLQLDCPVRIDHKWQELAISRQSLQSPRIKLVPEQLKPYTLIVSHGSVFEALCRTLAIPVKVLDNCSLVEISIGNTIKIHHSGYPLMSCLE